MYSLLIIVAYLAIGYLLHLVIFPEKKPAIATYFRPGQVFYSKAEGVRQTVIKQENGLVHIVSEVEPYAGGPPAHIHSSMAESFAIENGELTFLVDGKTIRLRPGEVLEVPTGRAHKFFNETGETIRVNGTFAFPEEFAFYLAQIYNVMNNVPDFGKTPKTLLQIAMFQSAGFDSYIADGPPVFIQKAMAFLLTPLARLLGYKSYYQAEEAAVVQAP